MDINLLFNYMATDSKEYFVPIGNSCLVSSYLRHINYRKDAFVFDWNITPIQSAIELINNDFEDFLKKENLIFLEPTNRLLFEENGLDVKVTEDIITPVYDKKYNMLFVHDFSGEGAAEYEKIRTKYLRRVEKLRNILKDKSSKINFIYINSDINNWQREQYEKAGHEFSTLSTQEIHNLSIDRENSEVISLDKFKKSTIVLRVYRKILKKLGLIDKW